MTLLVWLDWAGGYRQGAGVRGGPRVPTRYHRAGLRGEHRAAGGRGRGGPLHIQHRCAGRVSHLNLSEDVEELPWVKQTIVT